MTIIDAVNYARAGQCVRRAIWRPDLWLAQNYIAMHLAVVGDHTQPYTLTLDDLTADDWLHSVNAAVCAHRSMPNADRTLWVCADCGATEPYDAR